MNSDCSDVRCNFGIYIRMSDPDVLGSFLDLQNLAYSLRVTLSSDFNSGDYEGIKAVIGMFKVMALTGREGYPWLRIVLGDNYAIHEQEVFATGKCHNCGMLMFAYGKLLIVSTWRHLEKNNEYQ